MPTIREATASDVDVIVRHRRRMFEDMGRRDTAALDAMSAASVDWMRSALADGSYRGWLAEEEAAGGQIVAGGGVVIVSFPPGPTDPRPRRVWILNVYTEPEWRRRGLARQLMKRMIDWCREQGFVQVSLHASDDGRPLYEALGFVPTNEMRLKLR